MNEEKSNFYISVFALLAIVGIVLLSSLAPFNFISDRSDSNLFGRATTTTSSLGKVAFWCGKVNQHFDGSSWQTDSDGISGCYYNKLDYCKKFWPNTISVQKGDFESINTWMGAGNANGPYVGMAQTFDCLGSQGQAITVANLQTTQTPLRESTTNPVINQRPNLQTTSNTPSQPSITTTQTTIGSSSDPVISTPKTMTVISSGDDFICGNQLIDSRDSKSYYTVLIGSQCWMAENLNVGTKIDGKHNQANNNVIERYCYDDIQHNCFKYGGLYQWNEAMQYETTESAQGICPAGWHIPSDDEWKIMEMSVGMTEVEANDFGYRGTNENNLLREAGVEHWNAPNADATNSFGFAALGAGYRNKNNPKFDYFGETANFWASSLHPGSQSSAYYRNLWIGTDKIYRMLTNKLNGFSVRCVLDEPNTILECVQDNFSCCLGDVCQTSTSISCFNGALNFLGCDVDCNPLGFECVLNSPGTGSNNNSTNSSGNESFNATNLHRKIFLMTSYVTQYTEDNVTWQLDPDGLGLSRFHSTAPIENSLHFPLLTQEKMLTYCRGFWPETTMATKTRTNMNDSKFVSAQLDVADYSIRRSEEKCYDVNGTYLGNYALPYDSYNQYYLIYKTVNSEWIETNVSAKDVTLLRGVQQNPDFTTYCNYFWPGSVMRNDDGIMPSVYDHWHLRPTTYTSGIELSCFV